MKRCIIYKLKSKLLFITSSTFKCRNQKEATKQIINLTGIIAQLVALFAQLQHMSQIMGARTRKEKFKHPYRQIFVYPCNC